MNTSNDNSNVTDIDISGKVAEKWIVVLPLGATEQHGPHLPVETDTLIAEGLVKRIEARLPAGLLVKFLPAEPVGYSIEHVDMGKTRTFTFEAAVHRWIGIGENLHRSGIRKFVMLNTHGGNSPLMTIVATELRVRHAMLAVATSWTRFGVPENCVPAEEKAYGIHGGEIETSVMLALHPERVDMTKARDFPSFQKQLSEQTRFLRAYGPHAFGWKMRDLNPDGVTGNAARATAATGEALLNHAADGFAGLLQDIHEFDANRLD